jgi:hypothetical protein
MLCSPAANPVIGTVASQQGVCILAFSWHGDQSAVGDAPCGHLLQLNAYVLAFPGRRWRMNRGESATPTLLSRVRTSERAGIRWSRCHKERPYR